METIEKISKVALSHSLRTLHDDGVFNFVFKSLSFSYSQYGINKSIPEFILNTLRSNLEALDNLEDRNYLTQTIRLELSKTNLFDKYQDYKNRSKNEVIYRHLAPHIENTNSPLEIIDIGCGNNALGYYIASRNPQAQVTGTDVIDYNSPRENERVVFIHQNSSTNLPSMGKQFDIALLINVLHHVDPKNVPVLLQQIRLILKPTGKALILEDSFSKEEKPLWNLGHLWEEFERISEDLKIPALNIIDWIGVALIPKDMGMNIPFYFKKPEDWSRVFISEGFKDVDVSFLGFLSDRFHSNPQVLFTIK